MTSNGFSFGKRPHPPGGGDESGDQARPDQLEDDVVEAIEVAGEPVTRSEAGNLGLMKLESRPGAEEPGRGGDARASSRQPAARPEPGAPTALSAEGKIELIREHLHNERVDQALTLAQELVWEYPTLNQAKILIARCFIKKKEYAKASSILQALTSSNDDPEALYYHGVCLNHLDKPREAIEALQRCLSLVSEPALRKRTQDMLARIQGEMMVCPVCGKKVLPDAMVDVGERSMCSDCARSDDDDDEDDDGTPGKRKRRKKLKRPMTMSEILLRVVFVLLLLGLAAYALYLFAPAEYRNARQMLPDWIAKYVPEPAPPPVVVPDGPRRPPVEEGPRLVETFTVASSKLPARVVAGVELIHIVHADGMEVDSAPYRMTIDPKPMGDAKLDAASGRFAWTPDAADAGREFTVTFHAETKTIRSQNQVNKIAVHSGLGVKRVGSWKPRYLGESVLLAANNIDADAADELIVAAGGYWDGRLAVLKLSSEKLYEEKYSTSFGGRAAGMGVIRAGNEKWLAVADYWNSRLRFFALREGTLGEMALSVELPGRPIMADFVEDSSLAAVVCATPKGLRLLVYQQVAQLETRLLGEWWLPDEDALLDIAVLSADTASDLDKPQFKIAVLRSSPGGKPLLYLGDPKETNWQELGEGSGEMIGMAYDRPTRTLSILSSGKEGAVLSTVASYDPAQDGARREQVKLGVAIPLSGLAMVGFLDSSVKDVALLDAAKVSVTFRNQYGIPSGVLSWPLPEVPLFSGPTCVVNSPSGPASGQQMFFLGEGGGVWAVGLVD